MGLGLGNEVAAVELQSWKGVSRVKVEIRNYGHRLKGWVTHIANALCFASTGLPVNESVTSDIAIRLLYKSEKNNAPPFRKRPLEFAGAI